MSPATQKILNEMIEISRQGHEIIPMFFQPRRGISNSVSAAIRCGVKSGLIEQDGVDGCGKPKYRATLPKATHTAPAVVM